MSTLLYAKALHVRVRMETLRFALMNLAPGALQITGYTSGDVLKPSWSLTMTCQTCGGSPGPIFEWVTSKNVSLGQKAILEGESCSTLVLDVAQVGQNFSHNEVLTCRLLDGSDGDSRTLTIEGREIICT